VQFVSKLPRYVSGLRGNKSFRGAFGDQFSTGEPSYTVGFQFEVPIGNRAAKSRLQRSQFEAQVFHRQFEQQVGDVVLDARIAGREIERLNRENENNFTALQKAAQELDLIQQRQQLNLDDRKTGSLYIEDLLASQARLTACEARLAQSQISQAIALVDLKRATGELLRSGAEAYQPVSYEAVPFEESIPIDAQFAGQSDDAFSYPNQNGVQNPFQSFDQSPQAPDSFNYPAQNGFQEPIQSLNAFPAQNSDSFNVPVSHDAGVPIGNGNNYPVGNGLSNFYSAPMPQMEQAIQSGFEAVSDVGSFKDLNFKYPNGT